MSNDILPQIVEKFEKLCRKGKDSGPVMFYKLECNRPFWFKDNLSVANNKLFMARDDLEALYKIRKYMLLHGQWNKSRNCFSHRCDGSPLDIFKYAMECPQWEHYKSVSENESVSGNSDGDSSDDEGSDENHAFGPKAAKRAVAAIMRILDEEDKLSNASNSTKDTDVVVVNQHIHGLMGFYGLGPYAAMGDCALRIQKFEIEL